MIKPTTGGRGPKKSVLIAPKKNARVVCYERLRVDPKLSLGETRRRMRSTDIYVYISSSDRSLLRKAGLQGVNEWAA